MVPFTAEELQVVLCSLLGYYVKEVWWMRVPPFKFPQYNISEYTHYQYMFPPSRIDIQFSVKDLRSELRRKCSSMVLECNNECNELTRTVVFKRFGRSPLQYVVAHYLISIDPWYIAQNPCAATSKSSIVCRNSSISIIQLLMNVILSSCNTRLSLTIHPYLVLKLGYCVRAIWWDADSTLVNMSQSFIRMNYVVSGSKIII